MKTERSNVVSLHKARRRRSRRAFDSKRKSVRDMFVKLVRLRFKWLLASVGGLLLLLHFRMWEVSPIFVVLGTVCILATMVLLVPYPHWWELKQGAERRKYHGDDFADGL